MGMSCQRLAVKGPQRAMDVCGVVQEGGKGWNTCIGIGVT